MKRFPSLMIPLAALCSMTFGIAEAQAQGEASSAAEDNTLIVYLTRTENTRVVADMIQQAVGGDRVELELQTPYPEDYDAIVDQVDQENEDGYLPPLKTQIDDLDQYDIVFLGAPTWDMQLPPPMKSFLESTDLSGKTVIPFNTNGGYGVGSSFDDIRARCTGCDLREGFSVEGGLERDGIYLAIQGDRKAEVSAELQAWLRGLNLRQDT